ncbi:uncharacterized protein TrAtP1_003073 [Trichoderma atroviride]|uniref:uncharacterized protein n=1 Tax=Hypocrea atroviridis TaxID=63577 RepID=UPI003328508A|nr:hypothetical protein TrAtP1_003073 [Trichoderma atroviride]
MLQKGETHVREAGSSVEKRHETRLGDGGTLLQGLAGWNTWDEILLQLKQTVAESFLMRPGYKTIEFVDLRLEDIDRDNLPLHAPLFTCGYE